MVDAENYWRDVCAPRLRARKLELGREVPEREIAAFVHRRSGKATKRSLVAMWLRGEREPYISQFLALCEKLSLDPFAVLREEKRAKRVPLGLVAQEEAKYSVRKTRHAKKQ